MSTVISRRDFLKYLGIAAVVSSTPSMLMGATTPRVVIVGGGFAGSTCAKYLKMWGGSGVDVTLIEANANYVSPILSNLVLNGAKTTADLTFNYSTHQSAYSINVVNGVVSAVDSGAKTVTLDDGSVVAYDKLVLAPGIDFIPATGHDFEKVPHAWQAGAQTNLLKAQIDTMQDGDTFIMTIPRSPYRCPPGPYERACVVADYLKNMRSLICNVIVLDANPNFTVEADTFGTAFMGYGIDYRTSATVTAVDSDAKSVTYTQDGMTHTLNATVLNVIPNQKAAPIIFTAGVNSGNWAPVNVLNYESTVKPDIHIIGDSQGTGQPKAGHIGNAEAKICADAILRELNGIAPYAAPKTNSACYSPVSSTEASWLSAVYEYNPDTKAMQLVPGKNYPLSGAPSTLNYSDMFHWAGNLFNDTFA